MELEPKPKTTHTWKDSESENLLKCFTDGGCHNYGKHRGIGAWAWFIDNKMTDEKIQNAGAEINTTNNKMELLALCKLLDYLFHNEYVEERIEVYIDSLYVVKNINNGNYVNWMYNGWVTSDGSNVKNAELWSRVIELYNKFHNIELIHIRGHQGNYGNEKCDKLCSQAIKREIEVQRIKKIRGD